MSRDQQALIWLMTAGVVIVVVGVVLVHRRERRRLRAGRAGARLLAPEHGWRITAPDALARLAYPESWQAERTHATHCVQEIARPGLSGQWWATRSRSVGGVATPTTTGAFLLRVRTALPGKLLVGGVPDRPMLALVPSVFRHHVMSLQRTWLLGDPAVWEEHAATFEAALPGLLGPGRWLVLLDGELGLLQVGSPTGEEVFGLADRLADLAGALAAGPGGTPQMPRAT